MRRETWTGKHPKTLLLGLAALVALACSFSDNPTGVAHAAKAIAEDAGSVSQGALLSLDKEGRAGASCPLRHTDVNAEISGFLSRVTVVQQFENTFPEAIEAVYVFPLPQQAAVDDMTMKIGDRTVRGKIKRREEARAIYEAAKAAGNLASLLDQERPNIFTQSVANIPPGAKVEITISYVETLRYEEGRYEFSFPMVVGPRYIPGNATGHAGGGWAPDTDQVPDASRITPPVTKPGTRAGHNISIQVKLDAGVPVDRIESKTHAVDLKREGASEAIIRLQQKAVIPNKDFILTYDAAGAKVEDAVLAHHDARGGFFTLILQPPERVTVEDVTPKELVFVLDTSGSMSGFPIEKAKEVIDLALNGMYPRDTFNLITFAGDTHVLFPEPVPATNANVQKAQEFLKSRSGGGGTEMMKAIRMSLEPSDKQEHIRIVCFMTDGYVGNDMEILGEIQKHSNARVFSFGVGSSVNRFLLDKMAEVSRGEVEYVALNDNGSAAARRFHERVRNPLLTDVEIDWGGLPISDVYPERVPDLFTAKPVIVSGRYSGPARGMIRLRGKMSGQGIVRTIAVDLPTDEPEHDVLATLWARRKIDNLMAKDWSGLQSGNPEPDVRESVTKLGLEFRLMTQFTSFVAVEETIVTEGGRPRRIDVPVEMPEGVSYEGVFGKEEKVAGRVMAVRKLNVAPTSFRRKDVAQDAAAPISSARIAEQIAVPTEREEADLGDVAKIQKLDPRLAQLVAGRSPARIAVLDGKVAVEIWLAEVTPEMLTRLKGLGFEVIMEPRIAKVIIGRLPVDKLEEVASMTEVRHIAPYLGR